MGVFKARHECDPYLGVRKIRKVINQLLAEGKDCTDAIREMEKAIRWQYASNMEFLEEATKRNERIHEIEDSGKKAKRRRIRVVRKSNTNPVCS